MRKIALIALAVLLVACSGKPSTAQLKSEFWNSLDADGVGEIFELSNFEKLNGYEKSKRVYIADVRYQLTFKKGLDELTEALKHSSEEQPLHALGAGMGLMALKLRYGNFKAGDQITQEDKITYIKTEQGWRVEN